MVLAPPTHHLPAQWKAPRKRGAVDVGRKRVQMTDRLHAAFGAARERGLQALLVSAPANTYYLTGFRAVTYTRPVILVLTEEPVLVIPELESTHAQARSHVRDIRTYSDLGLGGKSALHLALDLAVDVLRGQG